MELDALRERIEALNAKLLPIANTPIPFGSDLRNHKMPDDAAANQVLLDAVDNAERFRKHLIHFSIIDQGRDWRDALLWMRDLLRSPFATPEVIREVAAMSDAWARDQMLRTISS